MKKLLGIIVLGLLLLNSNNVLSDEKFAEFHCDVTDGSAPNIPFSIDLDKGTMKWGWGKEYKISNISSKKIIGLKPDQNDGKNFEKTLSFNRYTGELTFLELSKPPYFMEMKCRKVDKKKKLF